MTGSRPFDQDVWVYYFDDPVRPALTAFTLVEDGSNLPPNVGWILAGRIELGPVNRPWVETMETSIEQNGYYLYGGGSGDVLNDRGVKSGVAGLLSKLE